jgi:hypothetical protein
MSLTLDEIQQAVTTTGNIAAAARLKPAPRTGK